MVSGVFDMAGCLGGAPILLSLPHLGRTEPDLVKTQVDGLNYDPEKHNIMIDVEPMLGGGFNLVKRLQFSLRVERMPFFR